MAYSHGRQVRVPIPALPFPVSMIALMDCVATSIATTVPPAPEYSPLRFLLDTYTVAPSGETAVP